MLALGTELRVCNRRDGSSDPGWPTLADDLSELVFPSGIGINNSTYSAGEVWVSRDAEMGPKGVWRSQNSRTRFPSKETVRKPSLKIQVHRFDVQSQSLKRQSLEIDKGLFNLAKARGRATSLKPALPREQR